MILATSRAPGPSKGTPTTVGILRHPLCPEMVEMYIEDDAQFTRTVLPFTPDNGGAMASVLCAFFVSLSSA